MSGRVRWRREGETVAGFRKTDRRQSPRRPLKDRLQEIALGGEVDRGTRVRLAFVLARDLEPLVARGPHPGGIEVLPRGFVRVVSWSADECFERAQAFFRDIAKDRSAATMTAVIINAERPTERYCRHLTVVRGAVVISSGAYTPRVYEAA